MPDTNYKLLSDEPAYEFEREDELRFRPAANVLARAALHTRSPITLGVFGNWGTGKTSLMRLMKTIVEEDGRIVAAPAKKGRKAKIDEKQVETAAVPVWFNAWQYEREEHLIIPLIATIARELEVRQKQWEHIKLDDAVQDAGAKAFAKLKKGSRRLYDLLRSTLYSLSIKGEFGVPGLNKMEISASMQDIIKRYEAITQDTLVARSLYFDAFEKLCALAAGKIEGAKTPQIVVFIDDLDRCFPEKAVHLLESIKLVLHLPNFAFVLGIYDKIIEEFVRNKYLAEYPLAAIKATSGDKDGDGSELRRRMNEYLKYFDKYLEKIVQVRHLVPERKPEEMHRFIERLLESVEMKEAFIPAEATAGDRTDLLELIAEVGERNPRGIVRRINGFIVTWRIVNDEQEKDKEPYSILAIVVNEKAGEPKYGFFRDDLDVNVSKPDGAEQTIGDFLSDAFEAQPARDASTHRDRILALRNQAEDLQGDETQKSRVRSAIGTLENDAALCNVLRTKAGCQWLRSKDLRHNLRERIGEVARDKSARDEQERDKEERMGAGEKTGDPIRDLENSMVQITGTGNGTFKMGDGQDSDNPVHDVKLDDFEICATLVTQAQYAAVMGEDKNPSQFKGDPALPVESVSWDDAMEFCQRLTERSQTGRKYDLPTEAQWEYACRAGSETAFCFGDDEQELAAYAWYQANSDGCTHPVGQKKPNKWRLYDMHGNVWEWCRDWYDESYYVKEEAKNNPTGPENGSGRVFRGGGWSGDPRFCRSAFRAHALPDGRVRGLGFRVLAVLAASKEA